MTPQSDSREKPAVDAMRRHIERRYAGYVHKTHGNEKSAGRLDLEACIVGRFVAIEAKAPGGRHPLSRRQAAEIRRIRRAGGIAIVARTVDELDAELAKAMSS